MTDGGPHDADDLQSRTELDSHANMVVVGRNAIVLNKSGRSARVNAFSPEHEPLEVPIVDAVVLYECPWTGQCHILVCMNALQVVNMANNLVPPFIMREAGLVVNDVPKIHVSEPDTKDHSIFFPKTDLLIQLSLWGVFSYFPTRKPTMKDLVEFEDNVVALTPDGHWNPHSDVYARNEEQMVD